MPQLSEDDTRPLTFSPTAAWVSRGEAPTGPPASTRLTPRSRTTLPAEVVALREESRTLASTAPGQAPRTEGRPSASVEIEEYFEAVVEEITDDAVRLRTRSSGGEEAIAWLARERIPESEQKYIALGAPARITVLVTKVPCRVRETEVRFLRPSQWYRPTVAEAAPVTEMLLERMQKALHPTR